MARSAQTGGAGAAAAASRVCRGARHVTATGAARGKLGNRTSVERTATEYSMAEPARQDALLGLRSAALTEPLLSGRRTPTRPQTTCQPSRCTPKKRHSQHDGEHPRFARANNHRRRLPSGDLAPHRLPHAVGRKAVPRTRVRTPTAPTALHLLVPRLQSLQLLFVRLHLPPQFSVALGLAQIDSRRSGGDTISW
jgi:hypothetical protein